MKTTVELPEKLFLAAKIAAVERRTTLRDLIESGLRRELEQGKASGKPRRIAWVTVEGGLPAGVDLADREKMHRWFQEDK